MTPKQWRALKYENYVVCTNDSSRLFTLGNVYRVDEIDNNTEDDIDNYRVWVLSDTYTICIIDKDDFEVLSNKELKHHNRMKEMFVAWIKERRKQQELKPGKAEKPTDK